MEAALILTVEVCFWMNVAVGMALLARWADEREQKKRSS